MGPMATLYQQGKKQCSWQTLQLGNRPAGSPSIDPWNNQIGLTKRAQAYSIFEYAR